MTHKPDHPPPELFPSGVARDRAERELALNAAACRAARQAAHLARRVQDKDTLSALAVYLRLGLQDVEKRMR
jgi:hypothetical protein